MCRNVSFFRRMFRSICDNERDTVEFCVFCESVQSNQNISEHRLITDLSVRIGATK
jgi:hypothetical protein